MLDPYKDGFTDLPKDPGEVEKACIIMAKGKSTRLPQKNMLLLNSIPLFVGAVYYAKREGITPVVFTDKGKVKYVSEKLGAIVFPQTPEQFEGYDAIPKAIEMLGIKIMGLIQCSNPFRRVGMLREMMEKVENGECPSIYTCEEVKMNGHYLGEYRKAITLETEDQTFHRFDGNMCVCTSDFFLSHGNYFLGQESTYIPNTFPLTWDIDTQQQYYVANYLAKTYGTYLPAVDTHDGQWISSIMMAYGYMEMAKGKEEDGVEKVYIRFINPDSGNYYKWYHKAKKLIPFYVDSGGYPLSVVQEKDTEIRCRTVQSEDIYFSKVKDTDGSLVLHQKIILKAEDRVYSIYAKHTAWEGGLKFDVKSKRGTRASGKDGFTVLEFIPDTYLMIDWDAWGVEKFFYDKTKDVWIFRK